MPLYEYRNDEHGVSVDLHLSAKALPDQIVLTRVRVPRSINCPRRAPTMDDELAKGYQKLEERGLLKGGGPQSLTTRQIKDAIQEPAAKE